MNAKSLPRLYDRLHIGERVPLMIAAHLRQDRLEYDRLTASAKQLHVTVRDYQPYLQTFLLVTAHQQAHLLNLIGWFQRLILRAEEAAEDGNDDEVRDVSGLAMAFAWRFRVERIAWKQFCEERRFGDRDPMEGLVGEDLILGMSGAVDEMAIDLDVVARALKEPRELLPSVETCLEGIRAAWRHWEQAYAIR